MKRCGHVFQHVRGRVGLTLNEFLKEILGGENRKIDFACLHRQLFDSLMKDEPGGRVGSLVALQGRANIPHQSIWKLGLVVGDHLDSESRNKSVNSAGLLPDNVVKNQRDGIFPVDAPLGGLVIKLQSADFHIGRSPAGREGQVG